MKTANLSEVKDQLSTFVDMVRAGERVRILVRGVPAADLVPIIARQDEDFSILDLERRGIVRAGEGPVEDELLEPGPRVGGSPSDALVKERRRR